jgi:uracil-DNA glycosylase
LPAEQSARKSGSGPALPGSGWPGDPATEDTPVAASAADVRELAAASAGGEGLHELDARVSVCRACPRLVEWRESVARDRRRAFADQPYWGRPIPGWGSSTPRILILGLAPAAHGGNRTGRIFTGDRSGDWLFAALYRAGLAARPTSVDAEDGQQLIATRMVAAVRCAPPANKPTTQERDACAPWLDAELRLIRPRLRVVLALGGFAWDAAFAVLGRVGAAVPRPKPVFGHGARTDVSWAAARTPRANDGATGVWVVGSYHPSQQNTFTGKLTERMLDDVLAEVVLLAR